MSSVGVFDFLFTLFSGIFHDWIEVLVVTHEGVISK